jgi:hypothetical protein
VQVGSVWFSERNRIRSGRVGSGQFTYCIFSDLWLISIGLKIIWFWVRLDSIRIRLDQFDFLKKKNRSGWVRIRTSRASFSGQDRFGSGQVRYILFQLSLPPSSLKKVSLSPLSHTFFLQITSLDPLY